jgi:hypothetical protein
VAQAVVAGVEAVVAAADLEVLVVVVLAVEVQEEAVGSRVPRKQAIFSPN